MKITYFKYNIDHGEGLITRNLNGYARGGIADASLEVASDPGWENCYIAYPRWDTIDIPVWRWVVAGLLRLLAHIASKLGAWEAGLGLVEKANSIMLLDEHCEALI